jgi:hypothetical protein
MKEEPKYKGRREQYGRDMALAPNYQCAVVGGLLDTSKEREKGRMLNSSSSDTGNAWE